MPPAEAPSPRTNDPELLRATLRDAKDAYARLLTLIEHSLRFDPGAAPEHALAFEGQIAELMDEADARLENVRERTDPWSERRAAYPADLAHEVDQFLDLLQKGLLALLGQVRYRTEEIEGRRAELRQMLDKLGSHRQGLQGYRQRNQGPNLLDSEA